MDTLPDELIAHIFSFLYTYELPPCYQLSRRVKNALTTFHRKIQRPIADIVRITLRNGDNGVSAAVLVLSGPDRYFKNKEDYFVCKTNELLVRRKYEPVLCDFRSLEEAGEFVRQEVGSLAEALEIALGWITFKMFVEKVKIVADKDTLSPEIAGIILQNARKICDEAKYPDFTLHLNEDLNTFHADFINSLTNWNIRLRADSYPMEIFALLNLERVFIKINEAVGDRFSRHHIHITHISTSHTHIQKPEEYAKFIIKKLIREGVDIYRVKLRFAPTQTVLEEASKFNLTMDHQYRCCAQLMHYTFQRRDIVYRVNVTEKFLNITSDNAPELCNYNNYSYALRRSRRYLS